MKKNLKIAGKFLNFKTILGKKFESFLKNIEKFYTL